MATTQQFNFPFRMRYPSIIRTINARVDGGYSYISIYRLIPNQQVTHHCHQLRNSSARHPQFINYSRKHKRYSPATNTMGNPQQRKRDHRRITEQSFYFIPLKGFCFHGGSVTGEAVQDGLLFGFGEKLGCFRVWSGLLEDLIEGKGASKHTVWEEEEGVDPTENGRNAFYNKDLLALIYTSCAEVGLIAYPAPSRKSTCLVHKWYSICCSS